MNLTKEKGITLIALVVTIIILILLAGVSINLVLGENGIITKAKKSAETYSEEQIREKVTLILTDYTAVQNLTPKTLLEYLNEQKQNGNIQEVIDNVDGTYIIELNGYEVTIKEEDLNIIKIEKLGLRPEISDITITTTNGVEVKEKEAIKGTPLVINFTHTIEGGTTVVNKDLPYTTDGTETEVEFVVTGTVNEKTYSRNVKISLLNKYRDPGIAEMVQIGDFINYSVGNWTQEDIESLGDLYSGVALAINNLKFGGFQVGASKDNCIMCPSSDLTRMKNVYTGGWRILSKNLDGTITIVHAGTPENYGTRNNDSTTWQNNLTTRNWSMYEDCSTNSVSTNYAVKNSARCLKWAEIKNFGQYNTLRNIGTVCSFPDMPLYLLGDSGNINQNYYNSGIRPVVTIKSEVNVIAGENSTHTTRETAWDLSLEE